AEERLRAEAVLFDLLLPLRIATIDVRPPSDPRARDVADGLLADPADPRTLHEWGRAVGASSRTLAHVRAAPGLAPAPRRAGPGQLRRPSRRLPDDERVRRRLPRAHGDDAGPVLPASPAPGLPARGDGGHSRRGP